MKADGGLWLAALVGAAAFLGLTHGAILDPRNTGWLFAHVDTATSYLGWKFYRQAPLLQLPFGANPAYGLEMGSSVVFSDSIPLAAFLFKPLSPLLPADFQYLGLWLALCFVLQAVFAYRLLLRFCGERALALLGSAFFLIAPPFLFRLSGHYALCGQWMILAALDLYFAPRASRRAWWLLLGASALVHFYLLAMAGAIWAADLWQRQWRHEVAPRRAAGEFLAGAGLTLGLMWVAGYFMIGASAGATPGFGMYRMNLLALVDPNRGWSRLLPDQPGGLGDHEGFSYLGIGMLVLAAIAGYQVLARRGALMPERPALVPLLVVSLLLTLYAFSNRVSLGSVELFAYSVPAALQPLADLLRGSGRMFWPVYYLLYLAILAAVFRGLPRRVALGICGALLALQIADCAQALQQYRDRLARAPAWVSPLKSPLWGELGARYAKVIYVLPRNALDTFVPWAAFAADHGLAINFGYFARVDAEKLTAARIEIERSIIAGRLQADSLYVFESDPLWNLAAEQRRPADVVGVLDGFRIIAPGLAACEACDRSALKDVKLEESPGYPLGESIQFGSAAARRYPMAGWSLPERWGIWSQAQATTVVIRLAREPARDLVLTLEGRAFTDDAQPQRKVVVSVNSVVLETLAFTAQRERERYKVRIPQSALAGNKRLVMIRFVFPDARVPGERGLGDDGLPRAFGLIAIRLDEI